jgi:hypothetical protein
MLSVICSESVSFGVNLTINSMEGLRSSLNDLKGLMNINGVDESVPFAAFILSIPVAPGCMVSGKKK